MDGSMTFSPAACPIGNKYWSHPNFASGDYGFYEAFNVTPSKMLVVLTPGVYPLCYAPAVTYGACRYSAQMILYADTSGGLTNFDGVVLRIGNLGSFFNYGIGVQSWGGSPYYGLLSNNGSVIENGVIGAVPSSIIIDATIDITETADPHVQHATLSGKIRNGSTLATMWELISHTIDAYFYNVGCLLGCRCNHADANSYIASDYFTSNNPSLPNSCRGNIYAGFSYVEV
jgi:hypothetical protein